MPRKVRQGNNPKRRVAFDEPLDQAVADELVARCRYEGAAYHKLRPADYDLHPPNAPRPHKSVCDDVKPVDFATAGRLMEAGIRAGLISDFAAGENPKYIWAVDENGYVYEARSCPKRRTPYHGYRLGDDDQHRGIILKIWKARCSRNRK